LKLILVYNVYNHLYSGTIKGIYFFLKEIQNEIGGISDRLECLAKSGHVIMDQTNNEEERDLIQSTISSLSEQLAQVKSWLEEKKLQV
jgi:nesprin-1